MFEESLELMSGFSMELATLALIIVFIIMVWISISEDPD
tara:strand:+ start:506 stop:622 length:117 start_codon:yes stop_codon:yes gene_type:complete